jgi:hypothetical protein
MQPGMTFHFRHMLVRKAERIQPESRVRGVGRMLILERRYHGFPASGIARYGIYAQRGGRIEQTGADQRPDQRKKAGRVAAGIRYPLRSRDLLPPPGFNLREAIGPTLRDAVGRRGIDDAGPRIADQRQRFPRRLIRET